MECFIWPHNSCSKALYHRNEFFLYVIEVYLCWINGGWCFHMQLETRGSLWKQPSLSWTLWISVSTSLSLFITTPSPPHTHAQTHMPAQCLNLLNHNVYIELVVCSISAQNYSLVSSWGRTLEGSGDDPPFGKPQGSWWHSLQGPKRFYKTKNRIKDAFASKVLL